MSSKDFCDECLKEIKWDNHIGFSVSFEHPLRDLEFCNDCFSKHWKPGSKRFSLKRKKIDPIDRLRKNI